MHVEKEEKAVTYCDAFKFNASDQELNPVLIESIPWFVANEVCKILRISNSRDAVSQLDNDEKLMSVVATSGQKRSVNLINESGLYYLIFQSRKPEAKAFRKWVTNEVLPAIRKNGSYHAHYHEKSPDFKQLAGTGGAGTKLGDYLDVRHLSYSLSQLNSSNVRCITIDSEDWYSVNDVNAIIGVLTNSSQSARLLNAAVPGLCRKLFIFGNTHPAWFCKRKGIELILSGSHHIKSNTNKLTLLLQQPEVYLRERSVVS